MLSVRVECACHVPGSEHLNWIGCRRHNFLAIHIFAGKGAKKADAEADASPSGGKGARNARAKEARKADAEKPKPIDDKVCLVVVVHVDFDQVGVKLLCVYLVDVTMIVSETVTVLVCCVSA